jgi:two-component system response regulator AtoC
LEFTVCLATPGVYRNRGRIMNSRSVLMLQSDAVMQHHLSSLLDQWGYQAVPASSVEQALAALAETQFLFSLVDEEVAGPDGMDLLRRLRRQGGDPGPIILLLADINNRSRILEAKALGAEEVVSKPPKPEELEQAIQGVLARPRHPGGGEVPADDATGRPEQEFALWRSPRMQEVWGIIQHAARVDVPVLICGETGTGKGLVARGIHHLSPRQDRPFVRVNCTAVPRDLLETELFGPERGAFTGGQQLKIGKFESAHHGTIFLDEIGELHPGLQAKVFRALQEGEFLRAGEVPPTKVDVRIIAATNQDLERAVRAGRFREDLYYALNVIQIAVPPLRERPEDIPLLANYFTERFAKQFHREGFALPPTVIERLAQHTYPGNVRELENIVKRMIVLNDPSLPESLLPRRRGEAVGGGPSGQAEVQVRSLKEVAREAARAAEREVIAKALDQTGWNRVRAARLLKISYRALLYKIKEAGLAHGPRPRPHEPEARGT